jgi:hypothetical protein
LIFFVALAARSAKPGGALFYARFWPQYLPYLYLAVSGLVPRLDGHGTHARVPRAFVSRLAVDIGADPRHRVGHALIARLKEREAEMAQGG